jgi:hypothetical protein
MVITKILTILPEQYKYLSSAWDSVSEDLKTTENLCGRPQLEESKQRNQEKQENVSFKVEAKYKGKNINRYKNMKCYRCDSFDHVRAQCEKTFKCEHCKKDNHEEKDCFAKNKKTCSICRKTNHTEKD